MKFDDDETIATALGKIQRREQLTTWVGASYAGYLAILSSKPGESLPMLVSAFLMTLLVVGVALLAYARVNFEYYVTQLSRTVGVSPEARAAALPEKFNTWPSRAEVAYRGALVTIVVMAVILLVALWLAAIKCTWTTRALFQVLARCT